MTQEQNNEELQVGGEGNEIVEAGQAEAAAIAVTGAVRVADPVPEPTFQEFPKIPRLSREVVITEKIDGTNAIVWVSEDGKSLRAGSRTRWITPEDDNFGFAKWVKENEEALLTLGPGYHYGEWAGAGIQRAYGLENKHFFLFNTFRWSEASKRPACCGVVPVLYQGAFSTEAVRESLEMLKTMGSLINRKFTNPEGVVIFHTASRSYFKKTIDGDAEPKKAHPAFRTVNKLDQ